MFWFAFASLIPAAFLAAACLWGGALTALALGAITGFVFCMDRLVARQTPEVPESSGHALSWTLGGVHFLLWGLGLWAVGANPALGTVDKILLIVGLGLYFGQISNSNANELCTAPPASGERWVFLSMGPCCLPATPPRICESITSGQPHSKIQVQRG